MPAKIDKFKVHSSKFIVLSFCFALYSVLCTLYSNCDAAPCYGTKMPAKKGLFAGVQTHSIFKRYLENESGKVRSLQHFFILSYGIYDWLSIDLKGGAGYIKERPQTNVEVDYPTNFAGGYGFRLKLYPVRKSNITKDKGEISNGVYDKKDTKIVFGFQHISVHSKSVHLGTVKNAAVLDDWQFSLLLSREIFKVTPYLGTRWSRVDYIHWRGAERKRVMSDLTKSMGLIFGLDIPISRKAWVNLEGQFFDSEAFACTLNYNF